MLVESAFGPEVFTKPAATGDFQFTLKALALPGSMNHPNLQFIISSPFDLQCITVM